MKADHKTSIVASADWSVIANSANIAQTPEVNCDSTDPVYIEALSKFGIGTDSPIVTQFESEKIKVHEFERTKRISTYLFAFVAGPFDQLKPSA